MDGRSSNRGKIGNKGGRKTKAEELALPMLVEEVIGDEGKKDLLKKIYAQAKKGSFSHQQLLMYYLFGKPSDKLDITTKGNEIKQVLGMVIK